MIKKVLLESLSQFFLVMAGAIAGVYISIHSIGKSYNENELFIEIFFFLLLGVAIKLTAQKNEKIR